MGARNIDQPNVLNALNASNIKHTVANGKNRLFEPANQGRATTYFKHVQNRSKALVFAHFLPPTKTGALPPSSLIVATATDLLGALQAERVPHRAEGPRRAHGTAGDARSAGEGGCRALFFICEYVFSLGE